MAKRAKQEKKKKDEKGKEIEEGKVFAALSYIPIIGLIFLFAAKENRFTLFHAKQGAILTGFFILGYILTFVIRDAWFLGILILIPTLIGMVMGAIKSLGEEKFKIPLVADLAEKIKV
ncbi:MAG TPA: hypothetical protein ENH97_03515 [bacterium]|nr:hypothetical protein [bacterium]